MKAMTYHGSGEIRVENDPETRDRTPQRPPAGDTYGHLRLRPPPLPEPHPGHRCGPHLRPPVHGCVEEVGRGVRIFPVAIESWCRSRGEGGRLPRGCSDP